MSRASNQVEPYTSLFMNFKRASLVLNGYVSFNNRV
jgi:hypothetical protein